MTSRFQLAIYSLLSITMLCLQAKSQTPTGNIQTKPVLFDGLIVAGYLDQGAYINCAGPGIKFNKKPVTVLLGLLPGLRIKEDKVAPGAPKNSTVTPSLGFGITLAYKHLAVQAPVYYNSKSSTKNGEWKPGIGIGYKF
ncbi:hypothetical protein [Pedobacter heparinus]|uniref:hypothetical protein n=1 Tax=Pedobacter heparinus TaxID=984 RepID=UPI0029304B76|nr:hypothetical protein [Pedobacter heparinus]